MLPQRGGRAETGNSRDRFHGLIRALQQVLRAGEALGQQPRADGCAGGEPEAPRKGATAHQGALGERVERMRRIEISAHPIEQAGQAVAAHIRRHGLVDELSLTALPVRWHDQPARDVVRHLRAAHLAQHVQTAIEPGSRAGRGQHVAIVHIQHVGIEPHARIAAREIVRPRPVGGGRTAVENARGGQHECTQTQPDQLRPARMGGAQCVEQRGGRGFVRIAPAWHDDRIRVGERLEPVRDGDRKARGSGQRAGFGRANAEVEAGHAAATAVLAEHHARHRKVEWADAIESDNRDDVAGRVVAVPDGGAMGGHRLRRREKLRDGPILANLVIWVTGGEIGGSEQCSSSPLPLQRPFGAVQREP
ncbi:hypothetical protein KCU90_g1519, partial [Aureobasidium melanogenum]